MISIKNMYFSYDHSLALENINFSVTKNDFAGIIGANGGGKSTLLKIILGLLKPSKGEVKISSQKISYVPQAANINPNFPITVLDLVLMGNLHKKALFFNNKKDRQNALKCLELVKMEDFQDKRFDTLSGGEKQRVLIARAMLSGCELMLLDEPTASIDAKGQIEIFELLKNLNNDGICIVCVCHDIALLSSYASKIIHVQKTCHIHENFNKIDKSRLLHLANHKQNLCEVDIWENYGISRI